MAAIQLLAQEAERKGDTVAIEELKEQEATLKACR